jgi:hypothetical protein
MPTKANRLIGAKTTGGRGDWGEVRHQHAAAVPRTALLLPIRRRPDHPSLPPGGPRGRAAGGGWRVAVYKIDPDSGERMGLLATACIGEGGWGDLPEPIIVCGRGVHCHVGAGRRRNVTRTDGTVMRDNQSRLPPVRSRPLTVAVVQAVPRLVRHPQDASEARRPRRRPDGGRTGRLPRSLRRRLSGVRRGRPGAAVCRDAQTFPSTKSTTQQPSTCGPPLRQWFKMSGSAHPASSRASARIGIRSKARSS